MTDDARVQAIRQRLEMYRQVVADRRIDLKNRSQFEAEWSEVSYLLNQLSAAEARVVSAEQENSRLKSELRSNVSRRQCPAWFQHGQYRMYCTLKDGHEGQHRHEVTHPAIEGPAHSWGDDPIVGDAHKESTPAHTKELSEKLAAAEQALVDLRGRLEQMEAAMKLALHEMCNTVAPRQSFTDAVDALDAALAPASPDKS